MKNSITQRQLELLQHKETSVFSAARELPAVLPKGDFISVLLASFSANILALALPIMTLQVYDRILVSGNTSTLTVMAGGVVLAVMAEWMLRVARSYVMGMAGARFEVNASEEVLKRIVSSDLKQSQKYEAGEYLEGLSSISKMRDFYAGHLVTSLVDMPFIVIYLLLIGFLAGAMVWVPIALLLIFGMVIWMLGRHMRGLVRRREEGDGHRYSQVIEMLGGLISVKAQGLESKMQRLYEKLLIDGSASDYAMSVTSGVANLLGGIMSQIMMVAIIISGAPMVIEGKFSMGALIACLLLGGRLTQPLMRALSLWAHFQEVRLAQEQVAELYALPQGDILHDITDSQHGLRYGEMAEVAGTVEMSNVAFRYQENGRWLLSAVSLQIVPGQTIALMGNDGVAKSAFLELLTGLYAPQEGEIRVDGLPVARLADDIRAKHVAYVPSSAVIFRGTILENLCQFQMEYEKSAYELSQWMGIADEVAKLPMGYETPISSSGEGEEISPGLRQRIAIVRALVTHPRLVLLDNADHALDRAGYNHLFELLGQLKGKATIVLVSEDQNLVRLADRKITLHQGALVSAVPTANSKGQI
ncbi:MAG: ATP-binding cassette domain-containing protein [Alphaproteobacteria bacterium]|nr:ATP-binding cassette domain-containing protein [Alphaproteobacteria bacterium]